MNFKKVFAIYKKEIKDALRNKRVLYSTIIVPLVVIPIFIGIPEAIQSKQQKKIEITPSNVMISGFRLPGFFELFAKSKFINLTMAKDPYKALREGKIDLYVRVVEKNPPTVEIYYNPLSSSSKKALTRAKLIIESYENSGQGKIQMRKLKVIPKSVITERELGGVVAGLVLGFLFIFGLISGAIAPGVDTIAGEKERKTLYVLLSLPVSKKEILLGKILNVSTISLITTVLMGVGFYIVYIIFLGGTGVGMLKVSGLDILLLVLLLLIFMIIASTIVLIASAYARSYREAQNYMTPVILLIVIPMIFVQSFTRLSVPDWYFYIPGFNFMILMREALATGINFRHYEISFITLLIMLWFLYKLLFKVFDRGIAR